MKHCIIVCIFILAIPHISCKKKSVNCGKECDSLEELLFQTGFNNATISSITKDWYDIHGIDTQYTSHNNWDTFEDHPSIGDFKINCGDGTESQRWVKIMQDPQNKLNTVLGFGIIEPHQKEPGKMKGRVQADLNSNSCITEFYQTVQIYFHEDMQFLQEWDESFSWLSIFEFWNNANWTHEKNPFRVTVNLYKPNTGKTDEIFFHVKGDEYKGFGRWKVVWQEHAQNFAVPFGSWLTVELYIKEGDNTNGRFYMAIETEQHEKHVLFNITNYTHHPKEKCPDGFSEIHALKFYTSEELIMYMKNNSKKLEMYWDNWALYRNKSPL